MLPFQVNREKPIFRPKAYTKNSFWQISRKLSILACMLLHNTYINVIIAHILACIRKVSTTFRGRVSIFAQLRKKGVAALSLPHGIEFEKLFGGSRYLIQSIHAKKLQVRIFSRLSWISPLLYNRMFYLLSITMVDFLNKLILAQKVCYTTTLTRRTNCNLPMSKLSHDSLYFYKTIPPSRKIP